MAIFGNMNKKEAQTTTKAAVAVEDTGMILPTIKSSESWSDDPKVRVDDASRRPTCEAGRAPALSRGAPSRSPPSPPRHPHHHDHHTHNNNNNNNNDRYGT